MMLAKRFKEDAAQLQARITAAKASLVDATSSRDAIEIKLAASREKANALLTSCKAKAAAALANAKEAKAKLDDVTAASIELAERTSKLKVSCRCARRTCFLAWKSTWRADTC